MVRRLMSIRSVPQVNAPSELSIVVPHFDDPELLTWFVEPLLESTLPIELIIVDDNSPSLDFLEPLKTLPCPTRVYRIDNEHPWGMTAASNWGMVMATSRLCLRTDIDHRFDVAELEKLFDFSLGNRNIARFRRILVDEEGNTTPLKPHTNSYLIRRDFFFEVGGYDERFVGNYGFSDRDFFRRARHHGAVVEAPLQMVTRASRERAMSRDVSANRELFDLLGNNPRPPLRLSHNIHLLWASPSSAEESEKR